MIQYAVSILSFESGIVAISTLCFAFTIKIHEKHGCDTCHPHITDRHFSQKVLQILAGLNQTGSRVSLEREVGILFLIQTQHYIHSQSFLYFQF